MQNDLISRSALKSYIDCGHLRPPTEKCFSELDVVRMLDKQPTIDAVPVVRCRECKESEPLSVLDTDFLYCGVWDTAVHCNGYCYHGTKMDGGAAE